MTGPGGSDIVPGTGLFAGENLTAIDLFVAVGDLDGDGVPEVAASADRVGGPRVKLYRVGGGALALVQDFFAIEDPAVRGGARIVRFEPPIITGVDTWGS